MLDKGCDVHCRNERGGTVLMESCESEFEKLSLRLIDLKIDVNLKDEDLKTALQ